MSPYNLYYVIVHITIETRNYNLCNYDNNFIQGRIIFVFLLNISIVATILQLDKLYCLKVNTFHELIKYL